MENITQEEDIVFCKIENDSLTLSIIALTDSGEIRHLFKDDVCEEIRFNFKLKNILQYLKHNHELHGQKDNLLCSDSYPLIKAYKKELEAELKKINKIEYIFCDSFEDYALEYALNLENPKHFMRLWKEGNKEQMHIDFPDLKLPYYKKITD